MRESFFCSAASSAPAVSAWAISEADAEDERCSSRALRDRTPVVTSTTRRSDSFNNPLTSSSAIRGSSVPFPGPLANDNAHPHQGPASPAGPRTGGLAGAPQHPRSYPPLPHNPLLLL